MQGRICPTGRPKKDKKGKEIGPDVDRTHGYGVAGGRSSVANTIEITTSPTSTPPRRSHATHASVLEDRLGFCNYKHGGRQRTLLGVSRGRLFLPSQVPLPLCFERSLTAHIHLIVVSRKMIGDPGSRCLNATCSHLPRLCRFVSQKLKCVRVFRE